MELQADSILHDRYRIIENLGEGGMGAVYLASDQILDTHVAVKRNFNNSPESVAQFLKEAQLLAALRHPNLPRVTDYFIIGDEQYLVMDYVAGDDLDQRLKQGGAQRFEDVMGWAAQLCSALNYMHRQNPPVIHRDIKPANIKVSPEGQAILVDFGIAKADKLQAQTATGASGYSPGYAPPEQYGGGRTGPYSDQFSLGATAYALLTGKKPTDSIQRAFSNEALIPIRELNPAIPIHIADAVLKAMSLKPADRFGSISEFQAAINNPEFRLDDRERQAIVMHEVQNVSSPTVQVGKAEKIALTEVEKKKRRNRNITIGIIGAILLACIIVVGLGIVFLPNLLPGIVGSSTKTIIPNPMQTATEVQAVLIIETTSVATEPVATETHSPTETQPHTEMPTLTETTEPSETEVYELVGESGVIAFASGREDTFVQIWTLQVVQNPQGEVFADTFTQLTFDEGDKDQPVWSPDGSQIAYVAQGTEATGMDIWVMDADGQNQRIITSQPGDEFDPTWAPDGSRIIFTHHYRDMGDKPIYGLVWMNPDGTEREKLSVDFVERDPTFSPDMNWLLYVISASSNDYLYFRGSYDDYQTPRGFDVRGEIFGEFGQVSDPAWAPAGNQFAYTRHDADRQNIVLVTFSEVLRNGVRQPEEFVLTDTGADTDAAWSLDAEWLAFTSYRDGGYPEVYLMPVSGNPQINLTLNANIDRSPDWKPGPGVDE